jgi:hypothetical protein
VFDQETSLPVSIKDNFGNQWYFVNALDFASQYFQNYNKADDLLTFEADKVDATKRGIFIGILAYTALSMNKFSGEQMWYVNERNEAAEAIGSDFFKIGSECLKYDGTDIDANENGFTSYLTY